MRLTLPLLTALAALSFAPLGAKTPPTPEQRIGRLESQLRQVQKSVFPKGQPADTAGFSDEPAATLVQANQLSARLDAIEQQMTDLTRASEENGNRLATMEADLARLRADMQKRERNTEANNAPITVDSDQFDTSGTVTTSGNIVNEAPPTSRPRVEPSGLTGVEAAYDKGFHLWEAKKYDASIAALKAMIKAYPDDRRVSWANNLIGRALLDKGEPRAAADVLLANYRTDKAGERAPDSLYYLGQASMKLGQPAQACKAYAELENTYGTTIRPALRTLLPAARAAAKCR
ncbi:MAG: tetratricopeptide repeat protein [Sphingomicrobium sp.]